MAKVISANANALSHALRCNIDTLNRAAVDAITFAWRDSDSVAECAALLGIHRNTCLRFITGLNLYDEKFG